MAFVYEISRNAVKILCKTTLVIYQNQVDKLIILEFSAT